MLANSSRHIWHRFKQARPKGISTNMVKQCQYHPLPAILTSPANITLTNVHLPTIIMCTGPLSCVLVQIQETRLFREQKQPMQLLSNISKHYALFTITSETLALAPQNGKSLPKWSASYTEQGSNFHGTPPTKQVDFRSYPLLKTYLLIRLSVLDSLINKQVFITTTLRYTCSC